MSDLFYLDLNSSSTKVAVLIHGLGANHNMWQFQWKALEAAGYRVIVPDMRGFGNTPHRAMNTVESMARDVHDLLHEIKVEKAVIIGLSMGGAIAMKFALDYPNMVSKLVLANVASRFTGKIGGKMYIALRYTLTRLIPREKGAAMAAKYVFPRPEHAEYREEFTRQILQSSELAFMETVRDLVRHDLRKEVNKITAPTLIIGGGRDLVTPPFLQKSLHKAIHGSKLYIFPQGGHVTAVDSNQEFNAVLLDFLR